MLLLNVAFYKRVLLIKICHISKIPKSLKKKLKKIIFLINILFYIFSNLFNLLIRQVSAQT